MLFSARAFVCALGDAPELQLGARGEILMRDVTRLLHLQVLVTHWVIHRKLHLENGVLVAKLNGVEAGKVKVFTPAVFFIVEARLTRILTVRPRFNLVILTMMVLLTVIICCLLLGRI